MSSNYSVQVDDAHYNTHSYDSLQRFTSYYTQKELVFRVTKDMVQPKVLEIGKGNGFLYEYLKRNSVVTKAMDIDQRLQPEYLGDIARIDEIVKEKFDVIACFEILEHIKYEDLDNILQRISNLDPKYFLVSVPQSRMFFSFWFSMNKIGILQKYLNIPFPIKHIFNGEHYWELGKKGYPVRSFRQLLSKNFDLVDEIVNPLDPYHRFFLLKNKKVSANNGTID